MWLVHARGHGGATTTSLRTTWAASVAHPVAASPHSTRTSVPPGPGWQKTWQNYIQNTQTLAVVRLWHTKYNLFFYGKQWATFKKKKIFPFTENGTFFCHECDSKFADDDALKQHMLQVHSDKPYKCDRCQAAFRYKGNLASHKTVHTGKEKKKIKMY